MKIFLDLDGTLIDVVNRHHKVYSEVVDEFGGTPLEKDQYWGLKRKKTKWETLLFMSNLPPEIESDFLKKFITKIEDPKYLNIDIPFPSTVSVLEELMKIADCYLVTLRRNRNNVLKELDRLDLTRHFTKVLTGHSESDGYDVKIALIREHLNGSKGAIIGDTEADIVTGKELGLKTIAVTSGIRDEVFLTQLEPDYIVSGIGEVVDIIKTK